MSLQANGFDLVFTDLMMPEMNGYELCNAIKNDISLSHIPVIILTAKSDTDSQFQKQFGMTPKEYEHQCRIRQESSEKD